MIFEPHQGTTARLFGGLFLCQFLAVACFSGLSKIAYFRLILESGIKRETVRNFSPRYKLGARIRINCFRSDPSIKSSLKFLRRTPWARKEVEDLYIDMVSHPAPASDNPWLRGRDG